MIAAVCLFLLLLVAPFEPRFTVPLGLFHLSLLEAVALPAFALMGVVIFRREGLGRPAPPVLALGCMVAASFLSASLADPYPGRALKFALRLAVMGVFAFLSSRLEEDEVTWGFCALTISGSVAALLALAEGLGARSLDVLLGAFREIPFNVAGVRRASAGSEYPNLGAAMILYALLAGVALLRARAGLRGVFVVVLTAGLFFTYSRGAWVAGLAGLLVVCWFDRSRSRFLPLVLYLAVLGSAVFRQEISQIRFGGENANDFYAAVYRTPKQIAMEASARTVVSVEVRNVGRRPWRKTDQIHLSYHLYQDPARPLVDGPRTDLPRDVLPGESVVMEAILRAPRNPGEYLLMWDLVHEDTTWFSGQGVSPGVVRLIVGRATDSAPESAAASRPAAASPTEASAIAAIPEPLAWRPSRLDLWRVALRMWAAHPFLGQGPDNYRWTYGTVAGKSTFDTRVFANNMYLEFAATLGTIGLAAFCAALGLALLNGAHAAPRTDTALIALSILTAMSVHGLADYLLAFTGHYLVFGFVVGALSRVRDQP